MKKTSLLAVLLLLSTLAFAQKEAPFIGTHKVTFTEDKTTATSFTIFNTDKDVYIGSLTQLMGQPAQNSSGVLVWENIFIDGIGKVPKVRLYDGIMTHDAQNKTACFVPFKDAEDKQKKLALLQPNQEREMRIEFTDDKDKCIVHSVAQEETSKKFLAAMLKKN